MSSKNEELENFLESVDNTLTGLQVRDQGLGGGVSVGGGVWWADPGPGGGV